MLPSHPGILAEATSTLIKTFSTVFFLNLHYTFITYDGRKSNKQRAKSNAQSAKSNEQRAKSNEQQSKSNKQRAKRNGKRAKSNEQPAKSNEQPTKSNEHRAASKKFSLDQSKLFTIPNLLTWFILAGSSIFCK